MSAFALEDGIVYHTYSTYSRGVDALWGVYQWLDRPQGAQQDRLLVAPPRRVRQVLSANRSLGQRQGMIAAACGLGFPALFGSGFFYSYGIRSNPFGIARVPHLFPLSRLDGRGAPWAAG